MCWYPDPKERPSAVEVDWKIEDLLSNERKNSTKIIESPDRTPNNTQIGNKKYRPSVNFSSFK